jgi:hypothetical protein
MGAQAWDFQGLLHGSIEEMRDRDAGQSGCGTSMIGNRQGKTEISFDGYLSWMSRISLSRISRLSHPFQCAGLSRRSLSRISLNYLNDSEDNRKMCSLYLSLMDRFDVKLEMFGDSQTRLERLKLKRETRDYMAKNREEGGA